MAATRIEPAKRELNLEKVIHNRYGSDDCWYHKHHRENRFVLDFAPGKTIDASVKKHAGCDGRKRQTPTCINNE